MIKTSFILRKTVVISPTYTSAKKFTRAAPKVVEDPSVRCLGPRRFV